MSLNRFSPAGLLRFVKSRWSQYPSIARQRESLALLGRPPLAYGLFKAADIASYCGLDRVTVCEFGVASGAGLISMIGLAEKVTAETGVKFRIVGFDTGTGLPPPVGYKDHPEIWSAGDYPMPADGTLKDAIQDRAELVLGDIRDTVEPFVASLDSAAPLGFISVDVDIYSSTKNALKCFSGRPDLYTPAVSIYFDDVMHFFANRWCGELAAMEEFNSENSMRKIDQDRSGRHFNKKWFQAMHVCHILDHPRRLAANPNRPVKLRAGGNLPSGVLN